ncbi:MAG: hypothetical protein K0R99_2960 [Microbacterium sp.]|jgi:hypothetical protein|uniref:hypothetical protein n=1 Tax=Microbacterium sp. TaxID=51671 RepID=UPI002603F2AB|nr:hypothetical protein [Microbacterium sp.]MDF2561514.1 hypothetical protein [Microbacterium sp.]
MKGRLILLGVGAAVAAVVLALLGVLGVPMMFAVAWLLIVLTIALVSRQVFFDESAFWPPERRRSAERGSEVSRLAWSINSRTGVAGHVVVRRVQDVLRRRLAHRGLDLDDPAQHAAVDALLGPGVRDALHKREVHAADLEKVLDAVERIAAGAAEDTDTPTAAKAGTEENR